VIRDEDLRDAWYDHGSCGRAASCRRIDLTRLAKRDYAIGVVLLLSGWLEGKPNPANQQAELAVFVAPVSLQWLGKNPATFSLPAVFFA